MGRPQVYSQDELLDAARELVLGGGARSATLNAIAKTSGAPKGSIYHRFDSLNELLAQMWIRAVRRSQKDFIDALAEPDPITAAIAGALAIYDFAQREPADAQLLASLRREDLIDAVETPGLQRRLAEVNRPLETAIAELARRLFGRATRDAIERTVSAVVDIPIGVTRRHLITRSRLPKTLREQTAAAVRAALEAGA